MTLGMGAISWQLVPSPMIKHFISTLLAILVAGGIAYGLYTRKQRQEYKEQLTSSALSQLVRDAEEIDQRVRNTSANTEYHLETLRIIGGRLKETEATLNTLQRADVASEAIERQKQQIEFLEGVRDKLAENLNQR